MPMPDGVYRFAKQADRPVAGVFEMKGKHFEGHAAALARLHRGRRSTSSSPPPGKPERR
jgi:hypothetical protein